MLPYCFLLLFIADGLAKLCFPARELTELLFIMQFLWKMNYKFQTALQIAFWIGTELQTSFIEFYLKRRYSGSRCGAGSQKKGEVEKHIFGIHLHQRQDLEGWA